MPATFTEVHERLTNATLRELVILLAGGVEGRTFNELAAVRERLLDIAFRDENVTFHERSLAAVWSRALDSVLMIMLETKPDTLAGYVKAKSVSMEDCLQFGLGSIGSAASDPQKLMRRLSFDGTPDDAIDKIRTLRSHLAGCAFGVAGGAEEYSAA